MYVRDLRTGVTEIVSISNDGQAANEWVTDPAISDDGRYVVFETNATNLVPQTTVSWQVYLYDRETDSLRLVSQDASGQAANRSTSNPDISGDGRYVVFQSYATNLVAGTGSNRIHVYLYDTQTDEVELVSRALDGQPADHDSKDPVITPDGRYIAYHGHAEDLVNEPGGPGHDVFVFDRVTETTDLVSVRTDGTPQDKGADTQTISDDGRFVAFSSSATNMVPSQLWDTFGIYVHDRETGVTERVSVSSDGAESSGGSFSPMISGDGRYVTFQSYGFNMAPEEELNKRPDIFVHDMITHETEKVTIAADGGAADSDSNYPSISADGRYVVYETLADNLHHDDKNDRPDIMLRDRGPTTGIGRLDVAVDGGTASISGWATFSGQVLSEARTEPLAALRDSDASLTGSSITYRAEREDLLFEMQLEQLSPDTPLYNDFGRKKGINRGFLVYAWSFEVDGVRWEARAQRMAATGAPDALPYDQHAKLFRCDPICVPERTITTGIGASGPLVRLGVPIAAVGLQPGEGLKEARAYVAPGESTAPGAPLAELSLADATIPEMNIDIGTAPPGSDEDEIMYLPAESDGWYYSHELDLPKTGSDPSELWARACLGNRCGSASTLIAGASPEPTPTDPAAPLPTTLTFTDDSAAHGQYSDSTTLSVRLTDQTGQAIPDVAIRFALGERLFEIATNDDGTARITPLLSEAPGEYLLEAAFEGTTALAASTVRETFTVLKEDTRTSLIVEGHGSKRTLVAHLVDADDLEEGVAGRLLDFYGDGEHLGTGTTSEDGKATIQAPPGYRGKNHDFEATFAGDDHYLGSGSSADEGSQSGERTSPRLMGVR